MKRPSKSPSRTIVEQIEHINRKQSNINTQNERFDKFQALYDKLPEELVIYRDYLRSFSLSLQYIPLKSKSALFFQDNSGKFYQIASPKDFIMYFIPFYRYCVLSPSASIAPMNISNIQPNLSHHSDWIQKIISLLLSIRKLEYQAHRNELRYQNLLNEKQEKAYNEIYYTIGWPPGFGNISSETDNEKKIMQFENNLYLSIPPHNSAPKLLTPELIKEHWISHNPNFCDKDCISIWEYFKKFNYLTESSSASCMPLCYVLFDDKIEEQYELKYTIRTKKWEAKICSDIIARDTLFLFKQTSSASNTPIRKDEILSYIFDFSGRCQTGLTFWSHYITDEISRTEKPNLFILYLNDDKEQEQVLTQLKRLMIGPELVSETQDLTNLLLYGITPNIITAVPYMVPKRAVTELIQKLLTCRTIDIPTSIKDIKLKYKSKKSVLIFCKHDKSPEDLKLFCRNKNIHVYETTWLGFSTRVNSNSYPLLSGSCDDSSLDSPVSLEGPEIAYVQWMLFVAKYHTTKQILPQKHAPEDILSQFIDKFCIVTGKKNDCFPSQEFYNRWVLDYYQLNDCIPIGYKRFNRFLRAYDDGQLYVKSIHKSASDNVQHIIGLQFLESKYEKMKSERVNKDFMKTKNFWDKLINLFDITDKAIQDVYQSIMENYNSNEK